MKKEIEINELIESYLAGKLSGEEMQRVRDRLQEDESLAGQVEVIRHLHEVISDSVYLDVRDELKKIHFRKLRTSKKIKRITGFGAAGLIVGLAVFFMLTRNGGPDTGSLEDVPLRMEAETTGPADRETGPVTQPPAEIPPAGEPGAVTGTSRATKAPDDAATGQTADSQTSDSAARTSTADDGMLPPGDTTAILPVEEDMKESLPVPYEASANGESEEGHDLLSAIEKLQDETEAEANPDERAATDDAIGGNDCTDVVIEALFITEASCNNEPTGRITIDMQTISGGRPPYAFSLNGKTYTATSVFPALLPGNYPVFARDDAGCVSRLETATIGTEDCSYEYAFAPGRGGVWTVPVRRDGTGMLSIYSKEGILVYSTPVRGGETTEWRGQTVSGQGLNTGLYQFVIRYDDGTIFTGNVTLVR